MEFESHVLKELSIIREELKKLEISVATLKVKASIWGLLGGAIPISVGIIAWVLKAHAF